MSQFSATRTLRSRDRLIALEKPLVMGILNITDDSFHAPSRFPSPADALQKAVKMISDGADIIDIGGYSSRPGAKNISVQEETDRIIPVIDAIRQALPDAWLSVDTFRLEVARAALEAGADMINDISGGSDTGDIFSLAAQFHVPYILMHMQGTPQTMQQDPQYENVIRDIAMFFSDRIRQAREAGVHDIILDPGFGFGKTLEHNYALLKGAAAFQVFELPLLAGISRKSMINKVLDIPSGEALNGTTFLHALCLQNGFHILRVHDVKEATECVKLWQFYQQVQL